MLVCGFSSLNVEQLKKKKKEIKKLGFFSKIYLGKFCISLEENIKTIGEQNKAWKSLLENLKQEKKIVPLYYLYKNEYIGLEYFEQMIKVKGSHSPIVFIIKKIQSMMANLVLMRSRSILIGIKEKEKKRNGNN